MRHSLWLFNLARTLAIVGALGLGSAVAWADEDNDSDRDQDRTSQSRDEDRSRRENNREDDDANTRGEGRNRNENRRELNRDEANRNNREETNRNNREETNRNEARRDEDRRSRNSDNERRDNSDRQRDLGAEFDTDDNDRLTVTSVEDDSIAKRARLAEDDVIISVDGRRFTDSRELSDYLRRNSSRRVPIIIEREGTRYTVHLQHAQQQQQRDSGAWLGVYVDDNEDGPVITQVYPNGPAAQAGLRRGDVVVQFNNEDVTDSEELVAWIEDERPHSRAHFTVLRDGEEMELTATLGDRNQVVARGQNQNSEQRFSQRESRAWQDDRNQRQDRNYTEFRDDQRNDGRGYSSYNYPGRGQQMQESRQANDQHQRLERMIEELRDEVRELRQRVDNNE